MRSEKSAFSHDKRRHPPIPLPPPLPGAEKNITENGRLSDLKPFRAHTAMAVAADSHRLPLLSVPRAGHNSLLFSVVCIILLHSARKVQCFSCSKTVKICTGYTSVSRLPHLPQCRAPAMHRLNAAPCLPCCGGQKDAADISNKIKPKRRVSLTASWSHFLNCLVPALIDNS